MADKTLTKLNTTFYYSSEKDGTYIIDPYDSYTVRWNSKGDSSWLYAPFTTGDYNVYNITIKVIDGRIRENGVGYPTIGIASYRQNHPGGAVSPVCLAKERDDSNEPSHGDGYHNCYDVTLSVNLQARTTYYLYLFIEGNSTSSSLAWAPLIYPLDNEKSRTTLVELHYNDYEYVAPITNYTVTLNKGTGISNVSGNGTYPNGSSVSISATPLEGYDFVNWTSTYNTVTDNPYEFIINQDYTYTANATLKTYIVSYNKGIYGSGTNTLDTKTYGQSLTLRGDIFTRAGYDQTGWSITDGGSKTYELNTAYNENKTTTLYPYWSIKTYPITYKPGTNGSGSEQSHNKTYNINLTLKGNIFTRTGYKQTGWSTSDGGAKAYDLNSLYQGNAPLTLYPYWTIETYIVSYNKGIYGSGTNTSDTKTYGQPLTLRGDIFTRIGYSQTGWATLDDGPKVYNLKDSYTKDDAITLFPVWTAGLYTISYDKGINGSGENTSVIKTHGISINLPGAIFTRTGYIQTGWSTADGGSKIYELNAAYNENETTTLYPYWTAITYEIYYNANGGIGSMNSSIHTYGIPTTLTENAFTYSGFKFIGWNTKADGTGIDYTDKASVSNLTTTNNAIINLFAQWSASVYTVQFNFNGGTYMSGDFGDIICERDTNYNIPSGTIIYDGRVLLGWSTSSNATTATYVAGNSFNNLAAIGTTTTLYAVWKAKTIKIKYHINNGGTDTTVTNSYTATSTTNVYRTLPSGWVKSGYIASGWSTSSSATTPDYQFGQNFIGDLGLANNETLHLYATWMKSQPWKLCVGVLYRDTDGTFVYV